MYLPLQQAQAKQKLGAFDYRLDADVAILELAQLDGRAHKRSEVKPPRWIHVHIQHGHLHAFSVERRPMVNTISAGYVAQHVDANQTVHLADRLQWMHEDERGQVAHVVERTVEGPLRGQQFIKAKWFDLCKRERYA